MTQTTDAALVERGRSLVADFQAADWCDCYPQGAALAEYATQATDTIEAQARRIEALEGALRAVAEGNLGPAPWQASYARLKANAAAALEPTP